MALYFHAVTKKGAVSGHTHGVYSTTTLLLSLRRHAQRTVDAEDLAIDHRILDNRLHEVGELVGVAEAARVWHHGGKLVLHLLGEARQ